MFDVCKSLFLFIYLLFIIIILYVMFYACSSCSSDFKVWSPCEDFFSLEQVALRKRSPCLYKVQNPPIP